MPQQPLLNGEIIDGHYEEVGDPMPMQEIMRLSERIGELEAKLPQIKRDAVLTVLQLLSDSLRHVASGKVDIPETVSVAAGTVPENKMAEAWKRWIDKFGATSWKGKFIAALLQHGELNLRQMMVQIGTPRAQTIYDTFNELKKLSLVRKNGEMYGLVG